MTTLDERLSFDLNSLKHLWPALQERVNLGFLALQRELGNGHTTAAETDGFQSMDTWPLEDTSWPPTLEAVLEGCGKLPHFSVILGVCEDGLPFLLDLTNPAPGSLIISGDRGSGKKRLLKALLASAVYLNPKEQVRFHLVTGDEGEFSSLTQVEQCQQVVILSGGSSDEEASLSSKLPAIWSETSAIGDKQAQLIDNLAAEVSVSSEPTVTGSTARNELAQLIDYLAAITEERRRNRPLGPAIILAIDDLARCVEFLDEEGFSHLYSLIKHGPRSRVWPLVTLSAEDSRSLDARIIGAFRTRLIGLVKDQKETRLLADDWDLDTRDLEPGQFLAPFDEEWLQFWICEADS